MSATTARSFSQAIFWMCLSGLVLVVMVAIIKALATVVDPMIIIWARFFFHMLLIMCLFPKLMFEAFNADHKAVHLSRTTIMFFSTLVNTYALTMLPLANVSAISFTAPIIVAFLAIFMLREQVTFARIAIILVGFSGTIMIVQPSPDQPLNVGAVLALLTALCYALYQISTRFVRQTSPMVSLFYTGAGGAVVFSVIVPFFWHEFELWYWAVLALIGALGAAGHLMIILALRKAEASKITAFNYVQLIYAIIISIFVFGDIPDLWSAVGAVIIVTTGLVLYMMDIRAMSKHEQAPPPSQ